MPYFDTNKKAYYCGKIYRNKGIILPKKQKSLRVSRLHIITFIKDVKCKKSIIDAF